MFRRIVVYLISGLLVVLNFRCERKKQSGLSFDKEVYDFKHVKKGEKVNGIFCFSNDSKHTITIESVSVECDCLYSNEEMPKKISPAQIDSISVEYNTQGSDIGPQNKTLLIRTDAIPRIYTLRMEGEVVP